MIYYFKVVYRLLKTIYERGVIIQYTQLVLDLATILHLKISICLSLLNQPDSHCMDLRWCVFSVFPNMLHQLFFLNLAYLVYYLLYLTFAF